MELGDGLNVLTGETGAGKSIVVDSLALLAGARAADELIRTDADTLSVTGVFAPAGDGWRQLLADAGLEVDGDEVLVRREISRSGRNRVFVNDQPTTLRLLADLALHLLRIHGQRDELGLVDPELQRVWLDRSGGEAAAALARPRGGRLGALHPPRRAPGAAHRRPAVAGRAARPAPLPGAASSTPCGLVAGEEEALRGERDVLRNSEAIASALGGSFELLFEDEGAAVDRLARSQGLLAGIARLGAAGGGLGRRAGGGAGAAGGGGGGGTAAPRRDRRRPRPPQRGRGAAGDARASVPQAPDRHRRRAALPAAPRWRRRSPSWRATPPTARDLERQAAAALEDLPQRRARAVGAARRLGARS